MISSSGMSDTIGAIFLVAIFAVATAIIGSSLLSQSVVTEVPAADLSLSVEDGVSLKLYNDGGDDIMRAGNIIYVDGIDRTDDFTTETGDPWTDLEAGNYIELALTEEESPESVIVVNKLGSGGTQLIATLGDKIISPISTETPATTPPTTGTETPTPTATGGVPPVADFSGSHTSGLSPLEVTFTDLSTNTPKSWIWTYGDGNSSTQQNPTHTYASAGTYTVSLTATNVYGSDIRTKVDYITVLDSLPTVIFSDDFEDGNYNGWTKTYDYISMTSWPAIGNYAVRFTYWGDMERIIPTTGYTGINVSFWMGAGGLESGESMRAYWAPDGSSWYPDWTLLKQINYDDSENDYQLHFFSYDMPTTADNNANMALRFGLWGSSTNDFGYVDNIRVEGYD